MLHTPSFSIHVTPLRLSETHLRDPESRSVRGIATGIAVSFCLHVLLFVLLPKHDVTEGSSVPATQGPLVVRLNPSRGAPPPTVAEVTPPQPPTRPRATVVPPPMFTAPSQTPQSIPLVQAPPAPVQPPAAAPTDFMSMVNARRAERAAAEATAGARGREPSADDIAMANINRNAQSLSRRDGTSGVFQILSKGHRAAQFSFRGWTNDSRNARRDVIDVDAGLNGNIDLAIIRRMIELIRTHYSGEFNWDSHRLGRVVVLSARIEDTAGLEEFMMREFFP